MPGQREVCEPFLERHRTARGWDIFAARDALLAEVSPEEVGRIFGPSGVLQYMRQMTCKQQKKAGKADQYSFAFDIFGVDPGHMLDEDHEETIQTDAMTEAEFDLVIDRCDIQIEKDITANKKRKALRDELRPIFRAHPQIKTIGEAIKQHVMVGA